MRVLKLSQHNFKEIIKISLATLKKGEVLLCPTDTVYGLLCDATNKKAVERIFKIKKREKTKPLGIFVKDIKTAKRCAFINKKQEKVLKENWPGKFTFILRSKKPVGVTPLLASKGVIGRDGKIGLRVPDYRLLNLILGKFKNPLAQTSANISGRPATTKIGEVLRQFSAKKGGPASGGENQSDIIINAGDLSQNRPSKVIDFTGKQTKILRY